MILDVKYLTKHLVTNLGQTWLDMVDSTEAHIENEIFNKIYHSYCLFASNNDVNIVT